jgi:hypothetical protein
MCSITSTPTVFPIFRLPFPGFSVGCAASRIPVSGFDFLLECPLFTLGFEGLPLLGSCERLAFFILKMGSCDPIATSFRALRTVER